MRRYFLPFGLAFFSIHSTSIHADSTALPTLNGEVKESLFLTNEAVLESAAPLNLEDALALAFKGNSMLSAAENEVQAVDGAVLQAGVLPNPELEALVEDSRHATQTKTVQLNQPIELGGKRSARVDAAQRSRDSAAIDLTAKRAEVRADLITAFYDVLVAQERMRLAEQSSQLGRRATEAVSKRVTAGQISPVEETKARVAEARIRVEATQAASQLRTARHALSSLWGNSSPRFERALGQVEILPPAPNLSELESLLQDAPAMRKSNVELQIREALTRLERARRVPDVTLSLGVKHDEEVGRNQAVMGVSVPLPLFDRNQGNLLEAQRRQDKALDELLVARVQAKTELLQACERLQSARTQALSIVEDVLPGAEQALEAASRGFEVGKFGFIEVLDAQRTLFQAKSQYLDVLAEAQRANADIGRILGVVGAVSDTAGNR